MRKFYMLLMAISISTLAYTQTILFYEDFEQPSGADNFTSSGNPGWTINSTLAYEGLQSYHTGIVAQDTSYAQTIMFNTTGNNFVLFSFAHIAKLSFFDAGILEISTNNTTWTKITSANSTYLGSGNFNAGTGDKFTAITYPQWSPAADSLIPDNTWWRVETFDISNLAANLPQVWLRFKAYDGNNNGSAGNYGWLIDSVKVVGYVCDPSLTPGTAAASEDSICNLDPVNLTLSGYYGNIQWLYSIDNGATWNMATGTGSNSDNFTVNPLQSIQYAAVTTLPGNCVSDTSNVLSIYVQQVTPPSTTGNSRCGIGNITLTASGAGVLNWYTDTISTNPINTGTTFTTYITNTTTFYVGSFIMGCESPRTPVTATMNTADPVTINATSVSLCAGESTTLSASSINSGYTYTWSPSAGLNTTAGPTVIATPSSPTMYYAVGDDGTCANFDSVFIDVGPAAIAGTASAPNDTVCTGNPMMLSLSGHQGNIQWYSSTDGVNWTQETGAGSNAPNYEVTPLINTYYMAILSSAGCPADTTNFLFIISDSPTAPSVTGATRCGYGSVTLQANGNGTVQWYTDSASIMPFHMGNSYTTSLNTTTTYYVATTLGSNPNIFIETFENNGNNLPPGWTATGLWHVTDACQTGTPPNPLRWVYYGQDAGCNFDIGLTSGDLTSPVINIPASATDAELRFRYIYNGENGTPPFGYDNASVHVSENGGPFTQILAITGFGTPTNVWTLATASLSSYAGSNIQLRWNFNTVDGIANQFLGLQVDSIFIKGEAGCEGPRVPVTATITPPPSITLSASSSTICEGDTSTLTVTSTNTGYSYTWSPSTGLNTTTGDIVLATPSTTTTYTLIADDGTCGNIDSLTITVIPPPVAGIASAPNDTVCTGNSMNLILTGQFGNIQWLTSQDGINWTNATGTGSNSANYEVTPLTDTYYQAVLSNSGCPNDTSNILFITSLSPTAPTVTGTTRCGYGPVTVQASGNGTINWFQSATSTLPLGSGPSFTDTIGATTTYYAENVVGGNTSPPDITIGTATLQNTGTTYPAPYGNWFWGARHQFLITASELLNAGAAPNVEITSLAFDVIAQGGASLTNFEIKIGHTTVSNLSTWLSGLTSVYLIPTYTETIGWNVHTFSTPFTWNGTDNIVVETCFNNVGFTTNAVVRQSTTSFTSSLYAFQDASGVCTNPGLFTNTIDQRPNMKLELSGGGCASTRVPVTATVTPAPPITINASATGICEGDTVLLSVTSPNSGYNYSWSPSTGLNTTIGDSVYAMPIVPTTYLVVADDGNCGDSASVFVNVGVSSLINPLTTGDTRCGPGVVNLTAQGSGIQYWYTVPAGGTSIATGNAYSPNLTQTQTFYVQSIAGGNFYNVGPLNNGFGNQTSGNTANWGMTFNVTSNATLDRIHIYPWSSGSVTMNLRQGTGPVLQTKTVIVTAFAGKTAVDLGWPLNPGTGYRIELAGGGATLGYNTSNAAYPYTVPGGPLTITGYLNPAPGSGTTLYLFFYDWLVSTGCKSDRVPVTGTILDPPAVPTITQQGNTLWSSSPVNNQWYFNGTLIPGATSQTYIPTQQGQYHVVVDNNGCSEVSNILFVIVGIEEVEAINLNIYPNPNLGQFYLEFSNLDGEDVQIIIYNSIGEIVYDGRTGTLHGAFKGELDISEQSNGMYFLVIKSREALYYRKLILTK